MKISKIENAGFVATRECSICGSPIGFRLDARLAAAVFDCGPGGNERLATREEIERLPSTTLAEVAR